MITLGVAHEAHAVVAAARAAPAARQRQAMPRVLRMRAAGARRHVQAPLPSRSALDGCASPTLSSQSIEITLHLHLRHSITSIWLFPQSPARRSEQGRAAGGRAAAAEPRCAPRRQVHKRQASRLRTAPVCHERPVGQRAQLKREIPNLRAGADAVEAAQRKSEATPASARPQLTHLSTTMPSTDSTSARCVPGAGALYNAGN